MRLALGPSSSSPPIFTSFGAWWKSATANSHLPEPILVPWKTPFTSLKVGRLATKSHTVEKKKGVNTDLTLGDPLPSQGFNTTPSRIVNATVHKETTAQALAQELNPQSHPAEDPGEIMAFQRADPRPFMSPGMIWEDIPNRPMMVRAVASSRPQPRNENVVTASRHDQSSPG